VSVLLIQLAGPRQAYSTSLRFVHRDTQREPSFSAVVGLLMAALGRSEREPIGDDLLALRMGVRVDRAGKVETDFHTVQGGRTGKRDAKDTAVTWRDCITDYAVFLVGLEGDREFLRTLAHALDAPVWAPFLGRRCCHPSLPFVLPDGGLREGTLLEALSREPWRGKLPNDQHPPERLRLVLPASEGSSIWSIRMDRPILSFEARAYAPRQVEEVFVAMPGDDR
jgi:CRISPR system Cascade subunit CasD